VAAFLVVIFFRGMAAHSTRLWGGGANQEARGAARAATGLGYGPCLR